MNLLPHDIAVKLPQLFASEHEEDPVALVKLFTPWTYWSWYVVEYDQQDICFGLVCGHEVESGYFSIREIEQVTGPRGLRVERDTSFTPTPVSVLRQRSR